MKVLMVASWYSAKDAPVMTAGVFHYEQSMALKKYCDVALLYPYDTTLPCYFSKEEEHGLLTYRSHYKPRSFKGSWVLDVIREIGILRRVCKDYKPDVIHAHCCLPAGRAAVIFGRLYGYPVVITEHSPIEQMCLDSRSGKAQMHHTYKHSSANVCVSRDSMERLGQHFPDCGYQVIYNGIIDPGTVATDGQVYARPNTVNCCIVAAFYSLDIKGYQFLIPAIRQLKDRGIHVTLHICGGGDYFDHYKALAKELEVDDRCIFYGQCNREKVYSIVSQMDFNISASIFECSGVSVEEAMLLGKPMLVTRSGGANSLCTEDTAIVVDRGSTEALTEGILTMMEKLPAFHADTIRNYANENFEIDHVSRHYMTLYRSVAKNKGSENEPENTET